jgi:hypothetical protein
MKFQQHIKEHKPTINAQTFVVHSSHLGKEAGYPED